MILNGYDTLVGSTFKVSEQVENTFKMLSTTSRLQKVNSHGVYAIDFENGGNIPTFVFPITVNDYRGGIVTVIDQRTYFNKSGNLVNPAEYKMIETAAIFQEMVANKNTMFLKTTRPFVAKALAISLGGLIARRSGLSLLDQMTVEVILIHYYNCLLTPSTEDVDYITQNVVKQCLNYDPGFTLEVISKTGRMDNVKDLLNGLKTYPSLFSLSRLDIGGLISLVNQTWLVLSKYNQIMGGSIELPHLYTAICYVSATERTYQKTLIGQVLDKKKTPNVGTFVDTVNSLIK